MKQSLKSFFVVCLFVVLAAAAPAYALQTLYLAELGNIPLIPKASLVENSSVVFDKPSGRIAEVRLVSPQDIKDIMTYYAQTLPPLGWTALPSGTQFTRENEMLSFEGEREGNESVILIRLTPKDHP